MFYRCTLLVLPIFFARSDTWLSPHLIASKARSSRSDVAGPSNRPMPVRTGLLAFGIQERSATRSALPRIPAALKHGRSLRNSLSRSAPKMRQQSMNSASRPMPSASFRNGASWQSEGERNANYIRTTRLFLDHYDWGWFVTLDSGM